MHRVRGARYTFSFHVYFANRDGTMAECPNPNQNEPGLLPYCDQLFGEEDGEGDLDLDLGFEDEEEMVARRLLANGTNGSNETLTTTTPAPTQPHNNITPSQHPHHKTMTKRTSTRNTATPPINEYR